RPRIARPTLQKIDELGWERSSKNDQFLPTGIEKLPEIWQKIFESNY
ncbi:hypothetical protein WH47_08074, partial [Habropoda laboriosa]